MMRTLNLFLALAVSAGLCADIRGQSCSLVDDINRVTSNFSSDVSSNRALLPGNHRIAEFAKLGSYWYFTATTLAHGQELWRTNGTPAGTTRVTDLNRGKADARITQIAVFDLGKGPRLWFSASNGSSGVELWTSDGTSNGTAMLRDINPGSASSTPHSMAQLGNRVLFGADGGTNGFELWSSDGSAAGTFEVKDIFRGAQSSSAGNIIAAANGRTAFFRAQDGVNGFELWKTDGTSNGTALVRDILPGAGSSFPDYLTSHGGVLIFAARGSSGSELYRSDGTAAGTVIVKDIYPGPNGSSPNLQDLAVVGSHLYFVASDPITGRELWRTDGSSAGTTLVADLRSGSSSPNYLRAFGYSSLLRGRQRERARATRLRRAKGHPARRPLPRPLGLRCVFVDPARPEPLALLVGECIWLRALHDRRHGERNETLLRLQPDESPGAGVSRDACWQRSPLLGARRDARHRALDDGRDCGDDSTPRRCRARNGDGQQPPGVGFFEERSARNGRVEAFHVGGRWDPWPRAVATRERQGASRARHSIRRSKQQP